MQDVDTKTIQKARFPESLFEWSNSGAYAISRSSDKETGWQKPPLRTRLIVQLEDLADKIRSGTVGQRINIFLVGGPGNGKTHAAQYFLRNLLNEHYDELSYANGGDITRDFDDKTLPLTHVRYIEDASAGKDNDAILERFVNDVEEYVIATRQNSLFLCCVNRGILATVLARIAKKEIQATQEATEFIATLSSRVSPDASPKPLWPFDKEQTVYIHPMDEESLLEPVDNNHPVAIDILEEICNVESEACLSCQNASKCPIHANMMSLRDMHRRDNLLKILRYYEIVAAKRLSFRDLFSIFSQLIIGSPYDYIISGKKIGPCKWVEKQIELSKSNLGTERISALFNLSSILYHNRLFGRWDDFRAQIRALQRVIKSVGNSQIKVASAILQSISGIIRRSNVSSAQNYLPKCASLLDPALQDMTLIRDESRECVKKIKLYEDAFCKSLTLGINTFLDDGYYKVTEIEYELLTAIRALEQDKDILDMPVSDPEYQSSQTILSVLRIIFSRMTKRAVGSYDAFVLAGDRLDEYRAMLDNDNSFPNLAARKRKLCSIIQNYLFPDGVFSSSMLATLGQTEPDRENGFFLQNSRPAHFIISNSDGVKEGMTRNLLFVKEPELKLSIKVNFDIYSALIDLQNGLKAASLPVRINDIFDGIRSRIQGRLSHEWDCGASKFMFCDRDNKEKFVNWSPEEGFFAIEK